MKSFILACIALSPALLFTSGCASIIDPISELNRETMRVFKPKPSIPTGVVRTKSISGVRLAMKRAAIVPKKKILTPGGNNTL